MSNRHNCERAITLICHCLVLTHGSKFLQCCGWYCKGCKGRINDMYKVNEGKAKIV